MLEMEGYEVVTALNAAIALARIETAAPDLILLDVALPTMSGYECIEQLRQHHAAIPIILFIVLNYRDEKNPIYVKPWLCSSRAWISKRPFQRGTFVLVTRGERSAL